MRTQRHGCAGRSIDSCVVVFCVDTSVPSEEEYALVLTNVPGAEDNTFVFIWQLFMD
jgi:hypothetical protein